MEKVVLRQMELKKQVDHKMQHLGEHTPNISNTKKVLDENPRLTGMNETCLSFLDYIMESESKFSPEIVELAKTEMIYQESLSLLAGAMGEPYTKDVINTLEILSETKLVDPSFIEAIQKANEKQDEKLASVVTIFLEGILKNLKEETLVKTK